MSSAVNSLLRTFGDHLDRAVLESVLVICDNDVAAAVAFLQAQGEGDAVDAGNADEERLPAGYMDRPACFDAAKLAQLVPPASAADRIKQLLTQESTTLADHRELLKNDKALYMAIVIIVLHQGVSIPSGTRARCLAAAWAEGDIRFLDHLLARREDFGVPEMLKALRIMDAPRAVRALEKRIAKLTASNARRRVVAKARAQLHDVRQEYEEGQETSVSGGVSKRVRRWAQTFTAEKLQFFAIQLPREPWKEMADLVHFRPSDFALPWFLPYVFGAMPPADCVLAELEALTLDNVTEVVATHKIPYSYLRNKLPGLPDSTKLAVAAYESMDILLWYYEELSSAAGVTDEILRRLAAGEEPTFAYGKLLERLLTFKMAGGAAATLLPFLVPIAEHRLADMKLPLSSQYKTLVLGDASYSMDCAIRVSTVIGSLLAAIASADLRFFNVRTLLPSTLPRNVEEVLHVATETKADGLTAPACTVLECLRKQEMVGCFVVVTDEIENEPCEGEFFAQVLYRYLTEVYAATVVFVSFLDQPGKGRMVRAMESLGINVLQFRLNASRPDLTKVSHLLALLSTETSGFTLRAEAAEKVLMLGGFQKLEQGLPDILAEPLTEEQLAQRAESERRLQQERAEQAQRLAEEERRRAEEEAAERKEREERRKKEAKEKASDGCTICMEPVLADTALIDCGHLLCGACAGIVVAEGKCCPFCRKDVKGVLRVFRP